MNQQNALTKPEPELTHEAEIIQMVMAAAHVAFGETATQKQVCDFCCGLVKFLELADMPGFTIQDWKERVENLHFHLGG